MRRANTRHEKMKFFQGLPYKGPMFTKAVITLSSGVHFRPNCIRNARDDRGNLENTFGLRKRPRRPSNSAPKEEFLTLKVKEHHLLLLFRQISKPIGTPLEGNPREHGE